MSLRLETDRLVMRQFEQSDAKMVHGLAGSEEVARTTLSIPHPYPDGAAEKWIESTHYAAEQGESYTFAIVKKEAEELVGCMSLIVSKSHNRAELGYWFGHPFWGQGFATEAAWRIVAFGFEELGLNRIYAMAMTKNAASYQVMRKIGMQHEGTLSQHVLKWGSFEDIELYGMTRADYEKDQQANTK
ncbi:N-acetyltransferase [Brevibacillus reuszeri]|uniref:Acetyltransferase n=1 Tax=Brevibacillus reuszeri TaxID=54915 RepID=A0A0K9YKT5_9BACL|nr:GNAT family N-acetyltransferase [Brevibacillus reuszeri]KNB69286.1 acetyltransferase [Brevibacillus reuszeri]MED1860233.1 GNAT family N-acetyltransferase [Brevibacillus reuszeri]GED71568.1 N-acetyltransferase [Brevibacillus reuszeri]